MPKFVIRGADKPEEIVEFWLEQFDGRVILLARTGEFEKHIAVIKPSGEMVRCTHATGIPGLQYDHRGRIKEVE